VLAGSTIRGHPARPFGDDDLLQALEAIVSESSYAALEMPSRRLRWLALSSEFENRKIEGIPRLTRGGDRPKPRRDDRFQVVDRKVMREPVESDRCQP
jgi:hypothetical protein